MEARWVTQHFSYMGATPEWKDNVTIMTSAKNLKFSAKELKNTSTKEAQYFQQAKASVNKVRIRCSTRQSNSKYVKAQCEALCIRTHMQRHPVRRNQRQAQRYNLHAAAQGGQRMKTPKTPNPFTPTTAKILRRDRALSVESNEWTGTTTIPRRNSRVPGPSDSRSLTTRTRTRPHI